MGQLTQFFQPPLYWQQFEDLVQAVFTHVYGDPRPQKVGRPGQAQNGVDVYGRCAMTGKLVGIQCKRMDELDENNDPRPGGAVKAAFLKREYDKANSFAPKLDLWVLATTAKRDAKAQEHARILAERMLAKGRPDVQVWSWDEFVTDLNRNSDLEKQYYQHVIHIRDSVDQDRIILELYAEAFSRPAFEVPLDREHPDDFMQAIKDTQRALSTGELLDRETRRVSGVRRDMFGARHGRAREA